MLLIVNCIESPIKPEPIELAPDRVDNVSLIYGPALLASNVLAPGEVFNESVINPLTLQKLVPIELAPAQVINASIVYVQTVAKVAVTSYDNPGGKGNRTGIITVTTTGTPAVGTTSNWVDGGFADSGADSAWWGGGGANLSITFDFGVGKAAVIQEVKHYAATTAAQGTWKWRGSQDGIAWTDLSAGFTFAGSPTGTVLGDLSANNTPYRFYRQQQISGTTNTPWMREWEFKISGL